MERRKDVLSWGKTTCITFFLASIVYILLMFIIITKSHAEGVKFTAQGTLWPEEALRELNAAKQALRDIRQEIKASGRKLEKASDSFQPLLKKVDRLEKRLQDVEKFKVHKIHLEAFYIDIEKLQKEILSLHMADLSIIHVLSSLEKKLYNQKNQLEESLNKDFGLSLNVSSSLVYGPSMEENSLGGTAALGVGLYLQKEDWTVRPQLAGGLNLTTSNFSWLFSVSVERYLGKRFSLGPYASVEQDLGNMVKGANSLYGSLGGLVRYSFARKVSLYLSLGVGLYGQKGKRVEVNLNEDSFLDRMFKSENPNYSPSFNAAIGLTYDVL